MSLKPAMTPLLNGDAVNFGLVSTSVTAMRGSPRLSARAAVVPAKPPPTTTTRGETASATAGSGRRDVPAATADLRNARRLVRTVMALLRGSFLLRIPAGDRLNLGVGKTLGDLIHDGGRALAGAERLHLAHHLGGVAAGKPRHRRLDAGIGRVAAGA